MLVGKTSKETNDRTRVVVDFIDWLDPGEAFELDNAPAVAVDSGAWSSAAPPVDPPDDTTPLTVFSSTMADSDTKVIFLLDAGTPGLTYLVSFLAVGSISGRFLTTEFRVAVQEAP